MFSFQDGPAPNPAVLAAGYAVFGLLWVGTTDQLVVMLVDDPDRVTQLQTLKGWVFVGLSTVLVYGLAFVSQRSLRETNERLDMALQQTSILDRILRHNIRNSCTVIRANTEFLAGDEQADEAECLRKISSHNERLLELSEKSRNSVISSWRIRSVMSRRISWPVPKHNSRGSGTSIPRRRSKRGYRSGW